MPLIKLEDIDDPRLRAFSAMTDSELRDPKQMVGLARAVAAYDGQAENPNGLDNGLFIAESKNVIERAVANGLSCFSLFVEDCWTTQSKELIERLLEHDPRTPAFVATHQQMQQITGYQTTRGPLAAFHRPSLPDPEELLASARRIAVLEDIRNFTNVGAIFRSAAALGIDAVLITPGCHDPFYRRAARVSMGTVFQVPWTRIGSDDGRSWTEEGLPLLRAAGFKTAALALSDDSIPLQDKRLQSHDKLALVLGTEGDGLAQSTIASCDFTVRIPMDHEVDSLNVAAASAVAFWELRIAHRE